MVLTDKTALVIGGGRVATRRASTLISCGARVRIVSPELSCELRQLVDQGLCQWAQKGYDSTDLEGVSLVLACTDDEEVNRQVWDDATRRQTLVNVADRPELCSFFLPAVLHRDSLSIAVSTDGASPMAARLIREDLEKLVGDETAGFVKLMRAWRSRVLSDLPAESRERFWQRVVEGQIYELAKHGELSQAEEILSRLYEELR